jgi:Flp pilus assembly protein TadG
MRRLILKAGRCRAGGAAMEAALVAPVLAGLFILATEGGLLATASSNMRAAVDTGAKMAMAGSKDTEAMRSTVLASWQKKPADATATVTRICQCGTVVNACTPCDGSRPPDIYYQVRAQGTHDSPVFPAKLVHQETIRVR